MYTVLLIEDDPQVTAMLRLFLSRHGHRTLLAANIGEASQIWSAYKEEIHLVLTDNNLPDGSGGDLAAQLAREKPALKVIVASGLPVPDLPREFYRVDKPFELSVLLQTIERALADIRTPK